MPESMNKRSVDGVHVYVQECSFVYGRVMKKVYLYRRWMAMKVHLLLFVFYGLLIVMY